MNQNDYTWHIVSDEMSDKIFNRFSAFIQSELGIKMPSSKRSMLQARLQKRLRLLKIKTYEEYYKFVFSPEGMEIELPHMIDVVTTNKTDFFREPKHFDYLTTTLLPKIIKGSKRERSYNFWSAGCSTGEEPYTLAMVLFEFMEKHPEFRFSIYATDISIQVLRKAQMGIYSHEKIEPIPMPLRKKYLLRSKDKNKNLVRIVPLLRNHIQFFRLNILDDSYVLPEKMDIIFFRNVLIYFNRPTQENALTNICRHLVPGGYLFIGHSETLNGLDAPLQPVTTTVYQYI